MTVRVGVIGCGTVTYHCHLPALRRIAGVRVVALADHDAGALERAAKRAPGASLLSPDALLGRADIDAVLVATPTGTHADLAIRVALAGKHLYLEKPIAISAAQAASLFDTVRHSGIRAAVGFNRRHHPIFRRAHVCLREGLIGRVHAIHSVFAEPAGADAMPAWKHLRATGGGVLLDLGSHHIDLVRWLLNEEVDVVSARLESRKSEHDIASIALSMRDGTHVLSHLSFRTALADTLELHGESGVLRMDRHRQTITITKRRRFGYGTRTESLSPLGATWPGRLRRIARPAEDPSYEAALRAFVDLVEGHPSAIATMNDGMATLAVVLAAEASATTGVPVAPAHR